MEVPGGSDPSGEGTGDGAHSDSRVPGAAAPSSGLCAAARESERQQRLRLCVLNEILGTERDYVGTLRFLQSVSVSQGTRGQRSSGASARGGLYNLWPRSLGSRESSLRRPQGAQRSEEIQVLPELGCRLLGWLAVQPRPGVSRTPPLRRAALLSFLPSHRLSNSFKISYIREAGALGPRRRELSLLRPPPRPGGLSSSPSAPPTPHPGRTLEMLEPSVPPRPVGQNAKPGGRMEIDETPE